MTRQQVFTRLLAPFLKSKRDQGLDGKIILRTGKRDISIKSTDSSHALQSAAVHEVKSRSFSQPDLIYIKVRLIDVKYNLLPVQRQQAAFNRLNLIQLIRGQDGEALPFHIIKNFPQILALGYP